MLNTRSGQYSKGMAAKCFARNTDAKCHAVALSDQCLVVDPTAHGGPKRRSLIARSRPEDRPRELEVIAECVLMIIGGSWQLNIHRVLRRRLINN